MTLDPDIKRTLVHTVHVAPTLSITPSGDPIHGDPVARVARCDPSHAIVGSGPNGEDDVSEWLLVLEDTIGRKDRVWPLGADEADPSQGFIPKRVEPLYDEDGTLSHYEVLL